MGGAREQVTFQPFCAMSAKFSQRFTRWDARSHKVRITQGASGKLVPSGRGYNLHGLEKNVLFFLQNVARARALQEFRPEQENTKI